MMMVMMRPVAVIVGVLMAMTVIVFMGVGMAVLISLAVAGLFTQIDHPDLSADDPILVDLADINLPIRKM